MNHEAEVVTTLVGTMMEIPQEIIINGRKYALLLLNVPRTHRHMVLVLGFCRPAALRAKPGQWVSATGKLYNDDILLSRNFSNYKFDPTIS